MTAELGEGTLIAHRYLVERVVAEGGMGRVLAARHVDLGTRVAIKLLKSDSQRPRDEERFRREARAAASLRGEHVVRMLDIGFLAPGAPFLVMEFVDGKDLGTRLEEDGPLPVPLAVSYVLQTCEGLAEAHKLGIVHRDLKPSNLLLGSRPDGSVLVKISDFGIAKWSTAAATTLTDTSDVLGSPKYMSPEQVREPRRVDARSDVWSLGVTLYQLITGRWPFEAYTTAGVLAAITADDPVSPREYLAGIDAGLEAVILRCLDKDRDTRIADTHALALALAPFADATDRGVVARIAAILANETLLPLPKAVPPPIAVGPEDTVAPATGTDPAASAAELQASTLGRAEPPRAPPRWRVFAAAALIVVGAGAGWFARSSSASPSLATAQKAASDGRVSIDAPRAPLTPASADDVPPSPLTRLAPEATPTIPAPSTAPAKGPTAARAIPVASAARAPEQERAKTAPSAEPARRDLGLELGPRK